MEINSATILTALRQGLTTQSVADTHHIASVFAEALPVNCTLALYGDLGSGKTTFIAGLARAWDIHEPVTSPTFAIMNIYQGTRTLMHIDAYRLTSPSQFDALGIEEWLTPPFCLAIEWPEKVGSCLPQEAWKLHFTITAEQAHRVELH
ncbi:MAG: tRNA (adenosine(37)-N6)-threonylcarbamoyltransferase complex ATPase subunit type 1 TsaE [Verrucomicrobia bacterium 21-51-4]|nr:MAG: tRNA (adenosine(37)-N6)-threonylcarbamoyltransferase complex ATPase subunit type 1 TsaE [Verrucomicrobia bacterium 21-51-4]